MKLIKATLFSLLQGIVFVCASFVTLGDENQAPKIYRTAVSPEFANGLHKKYLEFLASKLNVQFEYELLPFGRRLRDLESGKLDILVGLQRNPDSVDKLFYLTPHYENLTHIVFIRKGEEIRWTKDYPLAGRNVAVTILGRYFPELVDSEGPNLVRVNSLEQKIQLLSLGRVDAFIHFRDSTLVRLKALSLDENIVEAPVQPSEERKYYFVLSRQSSLIKRANELELSIKDAKEGGEFQRIREKHYEENPQ